MRSLQHATILHGRPDHPPRMHSLPTGHRTHPQQHLGDTYHDTHLPSHLPIAARPASPVALHNVTGVVALATRCRKARVRCSAPATALMLEYQPNATPRQSRMQHHCQYLIHVRVRSYWQSACPKATALPRTRAAPCPMHPRILQRICACVLPPVHTTVHPATCKVRTYPCVEVAHACGLTRCKELDSSALACCT